MTLRRFCLAAIFSLSGWAGSASAVLLPPVTVNGLEWLQPLDFVSLGWNDISTVCNPVSGACNGTLGGNDITGWTWAGLNDVYAMTSAFTGGPPGDYSSLFDTSWAPLFLQSFDATDVDPARSMVTGIVRERDMLGNDFFVYGFVAVTDFHEWPTYLDSVQVNPYFEGDLRLGAWLYRDPSSVVSVPAPATLALFALSLAILAYSRSMRNRTANALFISM